jgi:TonB family protein
MTFPGPPEFAKILNGMLPGRGRGGGGNLNPIRATSGELPPRSPIQIVRPTIPDNQKHELPIPPTIQDATAETVLTPVKEIGLPWMKEQTNSAGPGANHSIGSGPGHGMGDALGDGAGDSLQPGVYHPGGTRPSCSYCPDPRYTDAAREVKLQGTVTMQVLVGAGGRALRIQLVKGVGMGLDERAMEAVKTWKFTPARDAARRAVAEWVTVEAIFRLF